MKLQVLGCYGAELSNRHTCGFLVNESLLIDAGTICASISLSEQRKIRYILISHTHLDHTKGLPFLSENLYSERPEQSIVLIGLHSVLESLQRHLFNDQLWPDFTKLPSNQHPFFQMKVIREGEATQIGDFEITAFAVNHTIPCSGFLIRHNEASFLYSGDTYQTETIWKAASRDSRLKAAVIETSFPNDLRNLATKSKHLTPELLRQEFLKIEKPKLPLYVYHMKPRYLMKIKQELDASEINKLIILEDGMTFHI